MPGVRSSEADGSRDGIVSLRQLYEYVQAQVPTKALAVGGSQHPVIWGVHAYAYVMSVGIDTTPTGTSQ